MPTGQEGASLIAQSVKNLPAMQETWVHIPRSGRSSAEGKATHSSIVAWRIGACRATVHGVARVGPNLATKPPQHKR